MTESTRFLRGYTSTCKYTDRRHRIQSGACGCDMVQGAGETGSATRTQQTKRRAHLALRFAAVLISI